MKQPETIFQIDPEAVIHTGDYNYSNKPLKEWDCDFFADYMYDHSGLHFEVPKDNYFYKCFEKYLDDLPKVNNTKVYLYGLFSLIDNILNGTIKGDLM